MLPICLVSCSSLRPFYHSRSLQSFSQNPRICTRFFRSFRAYGVPTGTEYVPLQSGEAPADRRCNYAGVQLEETICIESGKVRLDSWIASRIIGISRARVQSSIRSGLVSVNGRLINKVPSYISLFDGYFFGKLAPYSITSSR